MEIATHGKAKVRPATPKRGAERRCHRNYFSTRYAASAILIVSLFVQSQLVVLLDQKASDGNGDGGFFVSAFLGSPVPASKTFPRTGRPNLAIDEKWNSLASPALFLRPNKDTGTDANEHENQTPGDLSFEPLAEAVAKSATMSPIPMTPRSIRVERMPRLPVWPVWAGVIDFFVGWIFGAEAGSRLEQYWLGGRVCPMQLDGRSTSPFLLLVHHHHNFWKWDALFRKLSALVLPEGFPAHPHRGFTTLTYFLPDTKRKSNDGSGGGGFVHRDSIGVKQTYGTKGTYKHQAQWLFTGSGMLHEEMFDFLQDDFTGNQYNSRYELYQLWVNVPGRHKLDPPKVQLLRTVDGNDEDATEGGAESESEGTMPNISTTHTVEKLTTTCDVVVIAGNYKPNETDNKDNNGIGNSVYQSEAAPLHSDLSVLHVTVTVTEAETTEESLETLSSKQEIGWTYDIPSDHHTLIVYVRKGSCIMETITTPKNSRDVSSRSSSGATEVPIHSTVFMEKNNRSPAESHVVHEQLIVRPSKPDDPVDILVLSGRPLYGEATSNSGGSSAVVEPIAMQGSMVMNNDFQIQEAYRDYQMGQMGVPWDHELNDEQWTDHVRQTTSRTRKY